MRSLQDSRQFMVFMSSLEAAVSTERPSEMLLWQKLIKFIEKTAAGTKKVQET